MRAPKAGMTVRALRRRWIALLTKTAVIRHSQALRTKGHQLKPTRKAVFLQRFATLSTSPTSAREKENVKSTVALVTSAMLPHYR